MRKVICAVGTFSLAVAVALAAWPGDLATLEDEVASRVTESLRKDLLDPKLLPESGLHRPMFFWHESGSVALVVPAAVRVGHELQVRRSEGSVFTDTISVRRILNVTEMWRRLEKTGHVARVLTSINLAVRQEAAREGRSPDEAMILQVLGRDPDILLDLVISETAGLHPSEPTGIDDPAPGELWCYRVLYGEWDGDKYCCFGDGDNCWIRIPCGGSGAYPIKTVYYLAPADNLW